MNSKAYNKAIKGKFTVSCSHTPKILVISNFPLIVTLCTTYDRALKYNLENAYGMSVKSDPIAMQKCIEAKKKEFDVIADD